MTTCNAVTWQHIRYRADVNRFFNPSFEIDTTGITASGATVVSRDSTEAWTGAYSLKATNGAAAPDWTSTQALTVSIGTPYYFNVRLKGVAGQSYTVVVYNIFPGNIAATTTITSTGEWDAISLAFTPAATTPTYRVGAAAIAGSPFYVDGLEVRENGADTYIDGDQIDCLWDGVPHLSSSRLITDRRGGGEIVDIETEYNFKIGIEGAAGMLPPGYKELDRVNRAGTEATGIKVPRRVWMVGGIFDSGNVESVRTNRNELGDAIGPYSAPFARGIPQPVRLRYTGNEKTLQIDARYAGGLDNEITANTMATHQAALRLLSNDNPYWYQMPQSGAAVDAETTFTNNGVVSRVDGMWGDCDAGAIGGVGSVYGIAIASNGNVFIVGDFTSIDGVANTAYCAYYSPLTETWNPLQTGLNTIARAVLPLPDGRVVLGGNFTNAGGTGADYATVYDPATNTFATLNANQLNNAVYGLGLDPTTGDVILVGTFTQDATPTTLNRVARWDIRGTAYSAVGTGIDGTGYSVGVRSSGQIIVGGAHTEKISALDPGGAAFYEVGVNGGANNTGRVVWVDLNTDLVYVGGGFTSFDGETVGRVLIIGSISSTYVQWQTMGGGFNANEVRAFAKTSNGEILVGGTFTAANDIDERSSQFIWTGSQLLKSRLVLATNGVFSTYGIAVAPDDTIYIATQDQSTAQTSPLTTVTLPDGAAATYPTFEFIKDGNNINERTLTTIENFTTQSRLCFATLNLLSSEIVRVNCQTGTITSSLGRNLDVYLLDGNVSDFYLQAGVNDIYVLVEATGIDPVLARMFYHINYETVDAAEDSD